MYKQKSIWIITLLLSLLIATTVSAQLFSTPTSKTTGSANSAPIPTMSSTDFDKQVQMKNEQNKEALTNQYNQQLSQLPQPQLSKTPVIPPAPKAESQSKKSS